MIVFDSHMHVGQFRDTYFSPEYISDFINKVNIKKAAISSTTICDEDYFKVISELTRLIYLSGNKIIPVLWLTPKLLKDNNEDIFLKSNISWGCLKIHGYIHNWSLTGKLITRVIAIGRNLKIPILLHTGGMDRCNAGAYKLLIKQNPNQTFILGHGRPIEDTLQIMEIYENAWVDTAFMPIVDVIQLVNYGFENRILFGTDFPIPLYYKSDSSIDISWFENRKFEFRNQFNEVSFQKILSGNFNRLFTI